MKIGNMMNKIQTLKDFSTDKGELQYLCKEFNCNENTEVLTKEQADYQSSISPTFKLAREVMNQEINKEDQMITNTNTQMKLNFTPNDSGYQELGYIIPSLTFYNQDTSKSIDIEFNNLPLFEKINDQVLIKDVNAASYDACSVEMDNVEQDIVVHTKRKGKSLIITAYYSHIGKEIDITDIKDTQEFVVEYKLFKQYLTVIKNCIHSDARIQRSIKDNLCTLPLEVRKLMPNILSSYTRNTSYYIEDLSKKPSFSESRDLMTLSTNRIEAYPAVIESNVVFISERFTFFPEVFYLSLEQFNYLGGQLLKCHEIRLQAQNTIADFSLSENNLLISASLFRESKEMPFSEKLWSFSMEIDRKLFLAMHKTISQTFF